MTISDQSMSPLTLQGIYFDGRSSRNHDSELCVQGQQATLTVNVQGYQSALKESWQVSQLVIEPPLARVRRVIRLPDGGRFETPDDAGVSLLEARTGRNAGMSRVRRIESSWPLTLGALVTLGIFVWGFLTYGLPDIAAGAAKATPRSVLAAFDRDSIKVLDNGAYLGPTTLSAARQAQLQKEFVQVRGWAGGNYPYKLLLRNGEPKNSGALGFPIGANAFALPNGTVVMTDQLVALSKSDRELMGVLAHETGHVTHRHTLSSVYQGLGLTLLGTAITGDIVSAGTFAAAVPAKLLQTGYSRGAETQADTTAASFMLAKYGTTKPLRTILARLETDDKNATEKDVKLSNDLLQTHPGTKIRIEHLTQLERAYLQAQLKK